MYFLPYPRILRTLLVTILLFPITSLWAQENLQKIHLGTDSISSMVNEARDSLNSFINNADSTNVLIQSTVDSINPNILTDSAITNVKDSLKNLHNNVKNYLPDPETEKVDQLLNNNRSSVDVGHKSLSDKLNIEGLNIDKYESKAPDLEQHANDAMPWDQEELDQFKNYDSHFHVPENPDQSINKLAGQSEVFKDLKSQAGKAKQNQQLIDQGYGKLEQMGNKEQWESKGKAEAQKQLNELFAQHEDKVREAQNSLAELKKKYSYVGNSNDLSTAIKKNSLKNKPLSKRFITGGQFQIRKGNPLAIDFAPTVMYRINKIFEAGVSGSYRFTLPIDSYGRSKQSNIKDAVGISGIVKHDLYKGFFAYGEGGYTGSMLNVGNGSSSGQDADNTSRNWQPMAMLGLGRQLSITSFLEGRIVVTYDFLHNKNQLNNSPWNVKFGFFLKDLEFKNKKKAMVQEFMRVNQLE